MACSGPLACLLCVPAPRDPPFFTCTIETDPHNLKSPQFDVATAACCRLAYWVAFAFINLLDFFADFITYWSVPLPFVRLPDPLVSLLPPCLSPRALLTHGPPNPIQITHPSPRCWCRIPFYYILKLAAVIYLQSPKTRGAVHLKDVVLKVTATTTATNRIEAQQRASRSDALRRSIEVSQSHLPHSFPTPNHHAHTQQPPKKHRSARSSPPSSSKGEGERGRGGVKPLLCPHTHTHQTSTHKKNACLV